jgi:hypothetical protein
MPLIGGTRIAVELVVELIAEGWSHAQILARDVTTLEDLGSSSRRAQRADDGLWVMLDYCQVGTDRDLRAPATLLPVLQ